MLSKEEKKQWNIDFWKGFQKEMRSDLSTHFKGINWLKYPTGINKVHLRMICDSEGASLNYDIQFKDESIRDIFWEQLGELRKVIESIMSSPAVWSRNNLTSEGIVFDRIQWKSKKYDYYNRDNWPKLYLFLKNKLMEFHSFYGEFKDILILLVD